MTAKTKVNLRYSALIVLAAYVLGYVGSLSNYFAWVAFYIVVVLSCLYSVLTALVMFMLLYESKKWYNHIMFLSSGMFNFFNSFVSIVFLINSYSGFDSILFILACLPILLFITQLILFLKINKQEGESVTP